MSKAVAAPCCHYNLYVEVANECITGWYANY